MDMKLVTVVGARPQFVKAAVISRAFAQSGGERVNEVIVHTGQHYDAGMSDVFFRDLSIPEPAYNLGIGGGGHGQQSGRMLEALEAVYQEEEPHMVLVYGDTNSCLAGALAATKLHIPVAHVEAGLRSFNRAMPEEVNRVVADHVSDLLFCPTQQGVDNLLAEGIGLETRPFGRVHMVGDVMFDASLHFRHLATPPPFELPDGFVLCTAHRAENVDDPTLLRSLFEGLGDIARRTSVIMPLHPRTRNRLEAAGLSCDDFGVQGVDPVGYLEMLHLLDRCDMVATDSGGVQKEAYFFRKPCLILRNETEWGELEEHGVSTLVGADRQAISAGYAARASSVVEHVDGLFGGGRAAEAVVAQIYHFIERLQQ